MVSFRRIELQLLQCRGASWRGCCRCCCRWSQLTISGKVAKIVAVITTRVRPSVARLTRTWVMGWLIVVGLLVLLRLRLILVPLTLVLLVLRPVVPRRRGARGSRLLFLRLVFPALHLLLIILVCVLARLSHRYPFRHTPAVCNCNLKDKQLVPQELIQGQEVSIVLLKLLVSLRLSLWRRGLF